MKSYSWKGIKDDKLDTGTVQANNQGDAEANLQAQNITVTAISVLESDSDKSNSSTVVPVKTKGKKVKNKDLLVFTKKFATMVQAGLPIIKTLKMLEGQVDHPTFKAILAQVSSDVASGSTLSESFEKHPHIFDNIYINILKAGETSGKLVLFMQKLVVQIEKSEKIRRKVKGALTYPLILLTVAVGVIILMMIKVVPVFVGMFASMGSNLPATTQAVVDISDFIRDPSRGGIMFMSIIAGVIALKIALRKSPSFKKKFDILMLKLPLIGDVIRKSTLAKIAIIEGNLSNAGVPVLESLMIIKNTMKNTMYIEAFDYIHKGISEGSTLSSLYKYQDDRFKLFPPTFWQMIEVGEKTGNMDEMFESIALFYEEEFDMIVDKMTEMLEPIMIVFMGTTIGFIIVAMYTPIFQIGKSVSG